jgi:hypothetical protein
MMLHSTFEANLSASLVISLKYLSQSLPVVVVAKRIFSLLVLARRCCAAFCEWKGQTDLITFPLRFPPSTPLRSPEKPLVNALRRIENVDTVIIVAHSSGLWPRKQTIGLSA